jgi:hypothetical protein
MHDEADHAALGQRPAAIQRAGRIRHAETHLGGEGNVRGTAAHRTGDGVEQLRLVQQRSAAPMAIDHGRRTAEVEIDAGRIQARQLGRVIGHRPDRTQQLHPHRRALDGGTAGAQFRGDAPKGRGGSSRPETRTNSVTAWS